MNRAQQLLQDRSHYYLLWLRHEVESGLEGRNTAMSVEDAAALGRAQFDALSALLKTCLDRADVNTFSEVERGWAQMFDDVWLPAFPGSTITVGEGWSGHTDGLPGQALVELLRRLEVLRFGLVMWTVHLLTKAQPDSRRQAFLAVLSLLARHYEDIDFVLDAFDAASGDEGRDATAWTGWFLAELPANEAHFVPTQQELLFAAVVLCARLANQDALAPLRPRDWFEWRADQIAVALDRLRDDPARWGAALGAPSISDLTTRASSASEALAPPQEEQLEEWRRRIERVRSLFAAGREAQEEAKRAHVRESAVDPERVQEVRRETLRHARTTRLLHDTLVQHAAVADLPSKPQGYEGLASRVWAPKDFFIAGSNVLGLDRVGRDLGVGATRAELDRLASVLGDVPAQDAERLQEGVRGAVRELAHAQYTPSLIALPLSWRLKRELDLRDLRDDAAAREKVPLAHERDFEGAVEGVPAVELVGMPQDRVWLLDTRAALRFEQWPSEDESGVRFEISFFDEAGAADFLDKHPEVQGDQSREETILTIQERAFISVYLCWRLEARDLEAVRAIRIPETLRRAVREEG